MNTYHWISRAWLRVMLLASLTGAAIHIPLSLQAQIPDFFVYEVVSTSVRITGYTGTGGAVVIPATINGMPVTEIGASAFWGKITDPGSIDSKMILQYAQNNQLKPTPPDRPEQRQLVALLDRRSHLTEMIAREKNRLQNSHISIRDYIRHSLDNDKQDLKQIEKALRDLIANDQELHQKYLILQSVKGVGEATAWTILAYMKEIGSLKRNQLVALAGLAPFNDVVSDRPRNW